MIREEAHPATGRPATVNPVIGVMSKPVGTLTIDRELGWVLGINITEDEPVDLVMTHIEAAESWDPDLFVINGWDEPTEQD